MKANTLSRAISVAALLGTMLLGGTATGGWAQKTAAKPAPATTKPSAAAQRVKPPAIGPARPLRLPPVVERALPNGLKIVMFEDHRQPAVWMRLALPAGTIRDPNDKVGLVQMAAGLLDQGTTTRTQEQIAITVDTLGASLGAGADEDYLTVSASGLSPHVDTLFDLMADITLRPTFPQEEIDRYRTRVLNGISADLAEPSSLASAALSRVVYGGHPYGNYSSGTPDTLPRITKDDLAEFHRRHFAPNVATLFVAGDITPDDVVKRATAAFGGWERKDVPAPPSAPQPAATGAAPVITILDRPDAAQTEVRIGTLTHGYGHPDRIPGIVAMTVLGLGQFEGRLMQEIRVKRGLTYGVGSYFSRNKQAGTFAISTFTKNESTAEVVRLALAEARKLAKTPPPVSEMQERKSYLIGSFSVGLAETDDLLSTLQRYALYGGGAEDLRRYIPRVQAVTPAQVTQVMERLNLEAPQVVLVGSAKAIEASVRPLGTVRVIAAAAADLLSPTLQAEKPAAAAATTPPVSAADTAEGRARLSAAIRAHGGDAFLNLKSLVLKGKGIVTPPGQGDLKVPLDAVTLTIAAPDRNRLDMKSAFGEFAFGAPGGKGAAWLKVMNQIVEDPSGGGGLDPTALLRLADARGFTVAALPASEKEKPAPAADGKPLRAFAVTDDRGKTHFVYLDGAGLVRRVVTPASQLQGESVLMLEGYRAVEGVQVPATVQVLQNGRDFLRLVFDSFAVNKPVEEAIFLKPKAPGQ